MEVLVVTTNPASTSIEAKNRAFSRMIKKAVQTQRMTQEEADFIQRVCRIVGDPELIGKIPRSEDYKSDSKQYQENTCNPRGDHSHTSHNGKRKYFIEKVSQFFPKIKNTHTLLRLSLLLNYGNTSKHSFIQMQDVGLTKTSHQFLGKGGYGKVKKATKMTDGKSIALKVQRAKYIQSQNEINHTKQAILNPQFTLYQGQCLLDEKAYLGIGFLEGQTLFSCLYQSERSKKWTFEKKTGIMLHVLSQVDALHQQGFVHLDLKPENIMLENAGKRKVQIVDLGLSQKIRIGETKIINKKIEKGTPAYVAPELRDMHQASTKADVYSLGIIMLHLFSKEISSSPTVSHIMSSLNEHGQKIQPTDPACSIIVFCKNDEAFQLQHPEYKQLVLLIQKMLNRETCMRQEASAARKELLHILEQLNPTLANQIKAQYQSVVEPTVARAQLNKATRALFVENEMLPQYEQSQSPNEASSSTSPATLKRSPSPSDRLLFSVSKKMKNTH